MIIYPLDMNPPNENQKAEASLLETLLEFYLLEPSIHGRPHAPDIDAVINGGQMPPG